MLPVGQDNDGKPCKACGQYPRTGHAVSTSGQDVRRGIKSKTLCLEEERKTEQQKSAGRMAGTLPRNPGDLQDVGDLPDPGDLQDVGDLPDVEDYRMSAMLMMSEKTPAAVTSAPAP